MSQDNILITASAHSAEAGATLEREYFCHSGKQVYFYWGNLPAYVFKDWFSFHQLFGVE